MAKQQLLNKWREYYNFLPDEKKKDVMQKVMAEINIQQTTFYARLKTPATAFSNAEKKAIAIICQVPATFIFPELDLTAA